jgi:hypothetical protein
MRAQVLEKGVACDRPPASRRSNADDGRVDSSTGPDPVAVVRLLRDPRLTGDQVRVSLLEDLLED